MPSPQPYICLSPECGSLQPKFYLNEKDEKVCPVCKSKRENHTRPLVNIHLLLKTDGGWYKGTDYDYTVGCGLDAKGVKGKMLTGEPEAATCHDCLEAYKQAQQETVNH